MDYGVTANAIDSRQGRSQYAVSQIVGPDGLPVAKAKPNKECLLVADLEIAKANRARIASLKVRHQNYFNLSRYNMKILRFESQNQIN
ncbi:MAG: hypothetical protein WC975_15615 [Phycisphaerae bacterium]